MLSKNIVQPIVYVFAEFRAIVTAHSVAFENTFGLVAVTASFFFCSLFVHPLSYLLLIAIVAHHFLFTPSDFLKSSLLKTEMSLEP